MSHGVHMAPKSILAARKISFWDLLTFLIKRKIVEHAALGVIYILKRQYFVSFVSPAAILVAILDFNVVIF